jgi:hypothetical protein
MVTHMRYTLLMLVALLGVMNPPSRPPGNNPPEDESRPATGPATTPCVYTDCEGEGTWNGLLYSCDECPRVFYYCAHCSSPYPSGEEGKHQHQPPAV